MSQAGRPDASGGVAVDLRVDVGPLRLQNPVLVASGTFGYGREYASFLDLDRLGGIMVKGVSAEPWPGNPPPRLAEAPAGMLNAIGLQNPGVEHFLRVDLPWLRRHRCAVIVNVIGRTVEEYAEVAMRLDGADGVDAIELNVSCPNIREGGLSFGRSPEALRDVVRAVRAVTRLPLLVKLTPNTDDIGALARACADAGADALSAINTLVGLAIDPRTRRPVLGTVFGGLSGPAIKPVALAAVWQAARASRLPVIGMGGITTGLDAVEFLLAGASAVAVGTATFVRPTAALDVLAGIEDYLRENGVARVRDLVGAAWTSGPEGGAG
ncbi:MAG: dihydroorotate dehydrogenase, partial [Clostridia bacterium]|nr:dihydroorotate dehydrogenase [Clostridia bacterium]